MPDDITPQSSGQPAAPAGPAPASAGAPGADSAPAAAPAAAPAGAEPAAGAPPASAQPPAPSAAAPAAPPAGESAPPDGTAAQRVRDAQRMMHAATADRAALVKQLEGLGVTPNIAQPPPLAPAAQPAAPAAGQPPAQAAPTGQPAGQAPAPPAAAQPFTLDPTRRGAIYTKYTAAKSDEEAVGVLVEEAANLILSQVPKMPELKATLQQVLGNQEFMDGVFAHVGARSRQAQVNTERIQAMEAFWKKHAPNVPTDLIWNYADEATRAKPGDLTEQSLYMLERALSALDPLLGEAKAAAQITDGIQRGQGPVLPGGSGLPAASGGGEQPVSFVDQMRRQNQGI